MNSIQTPFHEFEYSRYFLSSVLVLYVYAGILIVPADAEPESPKRLSRRATIAREPSVIGRRRDHRPSWYILAEKPKTEQNIWDSRSVQLIPRHVKDLKFMPYEDWGPTPVSAVASRCGSARKPMISDLSHVLLLSTVSWRLSCLHAYPYGPRRLRMGLCLHGGFRARRRSARFWRR